MNLLIVISFFSLEGQLMFMLTLIAYCFHRLNSTLITSVLLLNHWMFLFFGSLYLATVCLQFIPSPVVAFHPKWTTNKVFGPPYISWLPYCSWLPSRQLTKIWGMTQYCIVVPTQLIILNNPTRLWAHVELQKASKGDSSHCTCMFTWGLLTLCPAEPWLSPQPTVE